MVPTGVFLSSGCSPTSSRVASISARSSEVLSSRPIRASRPDFSFGGSALSAVVCDAVSSTVSEARLISADCGSSSCSVAFVRDRLRSSASALSPFVREDALGAASVSPTCGLGAADETPSCEMRARLASARSPALSGSRGSTNSNPPLVRDPPGSSNPPHDPLRSSRVWLLRFPSSLSDSDRTRVMGSGNRSVSMHQSTRS